MTNNGRAGNGRIIMSIIAVVVAAVSLVAGAGWAMVEAKTDAIMQRHSADMVWTMETLREIRDDIKALRSELGR